MYIEQRTYKGDTPTTNVRDGAENTRRTRSTMRKKQRKAHLEVLQGVIVGAGGAGGDRDPTSREPAFIDGQNPMLFYDPGTRYLICTCL